LQSFLNSIFTEIKYPLSNGMKKLIKKIFALTGFQISKIQKAETNPFVDYDYGPEAFIALKINQGYSMMPHINLITLYEQAVYCEKFQVKGAYVECGVWKGGAVGMMAAANLKHGKTRRSLHLFDAFDDICEPNPEVDGARALHDTKTLGNLEKEELTGEIKPIKGFYDSHGGHGTIEICNHLLVETIKYPSSEIHYHKGWFQDTIEPESKKIESIAILRLDGDWYDSVMIPLKHLYDKVSKGGVIVIDDYGYYDGCTKAVNDFLESRNITTFLSYSNYGCRYFVKP